MSKQRGNRNGDDGEPDVARILRDLAARERQLRDLTEQSLGFLEELAEARRLNGERDQLAARIGELERTLADCKRRLRTAGGAAVTPATGKKKSGKGAPAIEIVFHGAGAHAAAKAAAAATGMPVCWIGLPDQVAADANLGGVNVITNRDARTFAQCWNIGMAATTADVVLLLGPGASVDGAFAVPTDLPANAAILCPRIDRAGESQLGCDTDAELRLRPRPATGGGEAWTGVPWASSDAFLVRRAAFERLGTFDEGLLGAAALLDYTLRARQANFDVLGLPAIAVAAGEIAPPDALAERERLVLLATHRPDQLARALATTPLLWDLGPGEAPGFLAQLLGRLPTGEGLPEQRALVERVALGMVQHALPASRSIALVQGVRIALLRGFADAGTVAGRAEFEAALRRAETQVPDDLPAAIEALAADVATSRAAAAGTGRALEQTRGELREIDQQRHAQSDRAERAEGARQHTQQQLDQVQQWLREARKEVQDVVESRALALAKVEELHDVIRRINEEGKQREKGLRAEVQQAEQRAAAEVQQAAQRAKAEAQQAVQQAEQRAKTEVQQAEQRAKAQLEQGERRSAEALQRAQAELAACRQGLQEAERTAAEATQRAQSEVVAKAEAERHLLQRLDAALAQHRELEREYLATDSDLRSLREQLGQMARVLGIVEGAAPSTLQQRLAVVHEQSLDLAKTLKASGAPDAAALLKRLDDLGLRLAESEKVLREREAWIGVLLQEVSQRRLFPRPLQPHEQAFMERTGPKS